MIHSHEAIIAKYLDALICLRGEQGLPDVLGVAHCMGDRRPSLLLSEAIRSKATPRITDTDSDR